MLTVHLSAAGKLFSKAVSSGRQPVASLFKLFDWTPGEKTSGVQRASKGRSCQERLVPAGNGSLVRSGRPAAATLLLLALNP